MSGPFIFSFAICYMSVPISPSAPWHPEESSYVGPGSIFWLQVSADFFFFFFLIIVSVQVNPHKFEMNPGFALRCSW